MKELLFVTGNSNKLREAREILNEWNITNEEFDLPEIQELNSQVIIQEKVRNALDNFKKPLFVEDVSLTFDALNGLPGPLIKWFLSALGRTGLADLVANTYVKTAVAQCNIGYGIVKEDGSYDIKIFTGKCYGRIVEPEGDSDFGWDPIFIPEGHEKTFAQMGCDEKNKVSHRRKAFDEFKKYLEKK